ncbi:uncharacterized protein LOC127877159 [Dreissena polymorpha]|uniref:NTR domain-containing protein n=1 Tax=Dreissena polymorpha TaxID=45954 RepID=A0A9D4H5M1_DREPO|nr:uncharacterized protein LOC127877159 [Dreissena polymorpha]KAH3830011.1 hypothetical protein DPMN_103246 [Dreissena polymorpha]
MFSLLVGTVFACVLGMCEGGDVLGCTCTVKSTNLELGCKSDFIFKTQVISGIKNDSIGLYYDIKKPSYGNIYKFNFKADVSKANEEKIYTAAINSCGVRLTKGTYVLSGSVDYKRNKNMGIGECSSWVERLPISKESNILLNKFKQETVVCPV